MSSRDVKLISIGHSILPILAVVTITGLSSDFPFDDLTRRKERTSQLTASEWRADRWSG
jgi:hypothetical protein